ncbi:rRNA maturation RNase YbeY [Xinfangfangia pollutisoli]|uniref:rRNA maturation RNase YbeY n=1 Tax=Xinfangfangia pollutisoli TaxID=2865960 RepID=UPI001CD78EB8|nr:rRNA maturation RNase YbeY [Xinfangfangia pollutisoli]
MEPLVDCVIEDDRWAAFGLEPLAESAARAALLHLGVVPEAFQIALLGCDDARIAVLNADFRGKPKPTNVLSWPAWDLSPETPGAAPERPDPAPGGEIDGLGDIAIAWETCEREAAEQGKPLSDHVTHLIVHGTLHLLGYDHETEADAALMEGHEVAILATLGLSDPY